MHIKKNFILKRTDKKSILIDSFYSEEKTSQPIVIFCHGYKGFKDWGAWNMMSETIANAGFCFIKFNFSHNGGTMEQPIDFPDLEAFGNNNYTKELEDLDDVITWAQTNFENNNSINTKEICVIGHSRGGGISVLKTAEDARITKLITLASVCDFEKRTATVGDLEQWKKDGVKYVTNGRTKQQMPHFYQFYENFMANSKRLNVKKACENINVPLLIIHGDADTSVLVSEAENIHKWNPNSQLEIIENADHVFNVKHPWKSNNMSKELTEIIQLIIDFLN